MFNEFEIIQQLFNPHSSYFDFVDKLVALSIVLEIGYEVVFY